MRLKKWGMAGLAVVATGAIAFGVIGTAGIVSAQTPPGGGQGQTQGPGNRTRGLEMLAQQLGVSVDQLRNATREVRNQLIDQAVAAGRITKEHGDRLKNGPFAGTPGSQGSRRGPFGQSTPGNRDNRGMAGAGFTDIIGTLAGSMGLTKDDLQAQLRSGKTLAQVGAEHGRTPEMLKNTVITQMKADLQTAVTAGRISQRLADSIVAGADRFILNMINGTRPQFGQGQFGPRSGTQQGGPMFGPRGAGR